MKSLAESGFVDQEVSQRNANGTEEKAERGNGKELEELGGPWVLHQEIE